MNIREEARKYGGEEAVAEYDRTKVATDKLTEKINQAIADVLADTKENKDKRVGRAGIAEALSDAFGEAAYLATYTEKDGSVAADKDAPLNALVMALKSVAGAIQEYHDNKDLTTSGVMEKIMGVLKGAK